MACLSQRSFDALVTAMRRMKDGSLYPSGACINVKQTRFNELCGIDHERMEDAVFTIIKNLEQGKIQLDDFSDKLRKIQVTNYLTALYKRQDNTLKSWVNKYRHYCIPEYLFFGITMPQ